MVWQVIAAIFAVLLFVLKEYQTYRPSKEIQDGRKDLVDGNVGDVEYRVDKLCSQGTSPPRVESDEATAKRISSILGVAVDRFGNGKDSGTSGKVPE